MADVPSPTGGLQQPAMEAVGLDLRTSTAPYLVRIRPASLEDAHRLAPLMRLADVAEVLATGYGTPTEALLASIGASSEAWAWEVDGEVGAIFGVAPLAALPGHGMVWSLTSPVVERHRRAFLRDSRGVVRVFLTRWLSLRNAVDARYSAAVRWLRWLGAEVGEPVVLQHSGVPFLPFILRG